MQIIDTCVRANLTGMYIFCSDATPHLSDLNSLNVISFYVSINKVFCLFHLYIFSCFKDYCLILLLLKQKTRNKRWKKENKKIRNKNPTVPSPAIFILHKNQKLSYCLAGFGTKHALLQFQNIPHSSTSKLSFGPARMPEFWPTQLDQKQIKVA